MKRTITIIFMFAVVFTANAQQDFTFISVPSIGAITPFKYSSSSSLSPGSEGNQTWDFSGITYSSYPGIANETYGTPDAMYTSATIATSNIAVRNYSITTTGKTFYGNYISAGSYEKFTDGAVILTLPMIYNATTTDDFSGTGSISVGPNAGSTTITSGTATTVYDGYGTIITNYGTYTDAVRIKTILNYIETASSTLAENHKIIVIYDWYSQTTGKIIYSLYDISTASSGGTVTSMLALTYNQMVTGISSLITAELSFSASPNPTTDKLIIKPGKLASGEYKVIIINGKGEEVYNGNITINGTDVEVETSNLERGIYILNLYSSSANESLKFVKN